MKRAVPWPVEKLMFAVAAVACLASVAAYRPGRLIEPAAPARFSAGSGGGVRDVGARERSPRRAAREPRVWPEPGAQSAGPGWVYELFAPPAMYFDRRAGSFSVIPPRSAEGQTGLWPVELLGVRREPFRLQLAGYCGSPGEWLALFTRPGSAEVLLARPGHRFEGLGLTLQSFNVRRLSTGDEAAPRMDGVAGVAVLQDERSGREVVLVSGEQLFTETPLALVRTAATGGAAREVREGQRWSDGAARFRVDRIQLDPPQVVVAREVAGRPLPETMIVRLGAGPAAPRADEKRPPAPPPPRKAPPALATNP